MKRAHANALSGLLLSIPLAAFAGPFVTTSAVYTDFNASGFDNPIGAAASVGYQIEKIPLYVEGEFYYSGKFGFDGNDNLQSLGGVGYVGAVLPLAENFKVLLKGGYYTIKTEADGGGSINDDNFAFGGGVEVMFNPQFGLRAEVENAVYDDANDTQIYKLGLVWRPAIGAPRVQARPASMASNSPAPALASSQPAVVRPFQSGDDAVARPGSVLRATPREDSEVVQALTPSPLLKLESSIINATGAWWFVSSDIERGWLRADELVRP